MKKPLFAILLIFFASLACQIPFLSNWTVSVTRSDGESTTTPTGTSTPSPLPNTNTPTPEPQGLDLEIYAVDWLESGDLLITFESGEALNDDYYLFLGESTFNCRIAKDSNLLLFCAGRNVPPERTLSAALHLLEDDRTIYEDQIYVPGIAEPSSSGSTNSGGSLTQIPPGPTSPAPTP